MSVGVADGMACFTSAAAPEACGADADVPKNAPKTSLLTPSGPAMSGFVRPSIVGPWLLKPSSEPLDTLWAPTAIAAGDDAGSPMLPAALTRWSATSSPSKYMSMRGAIVVFGPRVTEKTYDPAAMPDAK